MDYLTMLSPFVVLLATALAVLLLIALKTSLPIVYALTLSGFYLALVAVWSVASQMEHLSPPFVLLGRSTLFYATVIIAGGGFMAVFAKRAVGNSEKAKEAFFFLLVGTLGGAILSTATHLAVLLLGLRLLSLPIYVLMAQTRENALRIQAAMRVFIVGEVFFAVFLFGVALVYFKTGTLQIPQAFLQLSIPYDSTQLVLALLGVALTLLMFQKWIWRKRGWISG